MNEEGGGASRTTEAAAGSSQATDVSQLEHVMAAIRYERRGVYLLVGGVVAFGAFAWSEIQRRLENLNHENARILAAQSSSVSADTYTANEQQRRDEQAKLDAWRGEVDRDRAKTVTRDEFQRDTKTERRAGISATAAVFGVAFGLIGLGLTALAIVLSIQ